MTGRSPSTVQAVLKGWRSFTSSRFTARANRPSMTVRPRPPDQPYKPTRKTIQPPTQPTSKEGPTPAQTLRDLWKTHWIPFTGATLVAGFLGYYIVGTTAASFRTDTCTRCIDASTVPTGRPPALTGENAEQFDKELNRPEWWTGVTKLRKRIATHAVGNVLELAIGTGRNLQYYDWEPLMEVANILQQQQQPQQYTGNQSTNDRLYQSLKAKAKAESGITSFTGLDISVDMLEVARRHLIEHIPSLAETTPLANSATMTDRIGGQLTYLANRLRLVQSDALHELPPPPHLPSTATATATATIDTRYDTIIQTFGLCSVSDPVRVLRNLASAVKPETGRIILLEHGRGGYGVVDGLLDKNAAKHYAKYGCFWNRDIEELVDEAVTKTPGLEVVRVEHPGFLQLGTLTWIELKMVDQ